MASQVEHLAFAARKAAAREGYIAYFLEKYKEYERLGEETLIERLGCSSAAYYRMALNRAPQQDNANFRDHLQRIAHAAGVSPVELARIIRRVWALQRLSEAKPISSESQMLLAARDRERQEPSESPGGDHNEKPEEDQNE